MARPTTLRGSLMLIEIGDGATPEVFVAPCALQTRGFNRTWTLNETPVADCDDPDAAVWLERAKASAQATISGSGTLAKEDLPVYEAFFESQDPRNVRITLDYPADPEQWIGLFFLTTLTYTGNIGELVQVELEFQSHGEVTWTTPDVALAA